MKWIKPSAETIAHFERIAPGAPLETRSMFGMPCRFLNGHMLVGVFQNSIMLRLSEADRALCIAAGANPFRPMGREMKGYVELAANTFDDATLKQWIARGMRFVGSLAPKLRGEPGQRGAARPTSKQSAPRRTANVARTATPRSSRALKKLTTKKAAAVARKPPQKKPDTKRPGRPGKRLRRGSGSKRRAARG